MRVCRPPILYAVLLLAGLALPGPTVEAQPRTTTRTTGQTPRRAAPPPTIDVDQELSQTSVWPGDRIQYRLTITVPAGMTISLEDLTGRTTRFNPFVLIDTRSSTEGLQEGARRYVLEYTLANYEIGDRVLGIPGPVFRYQAASTASSRASLREFRVPPLPIAIRSTLSRDLGDSTIRTTLPSGLLPGRQWVIWGAAGATGLLISAIPLVAWVVRRLRQWAPRPRRSYRRARREAARALAGVAARTLESGEHVKEAYKALEEVAHTYIRRRWEIETAGFTDQELLRATAKAGVPEKERDVLAAVVAHGHGCRYSWADSAAGRAGFAEDVRAMQEIFGLKREGLGA